MSHRGKHPNDDKCFASSVHESMREAVKDLAFLYGRGYSENSALELVGNRYYLNARQRQALMRIACSAQTAAQRKQREVSPAEMQGKPLLLDGYNVLIITEVALSGGYIFEGCDGCYRDIASIHGTYHKVEETIPALLLIGNYLKTLQIAHCHWFFDAPVSNSGRLKTLMREMAENNGFDWEISLVNSPDKEIAALAQIAATSDGWVIDQLPQWFNFTRHLVDNQVGGASVLRLG